MMKTLGFCLTLALATTSCYGQLFEKPRVCDKSPCFNDASLTNFTLSCGINGETIGEVLFASYGTPVGTCPEEKLPSPKEDDYDLNATAGCSLTDSAAIFADCVGEESCLINIADAVKDKTAGLEGCGGADLALGVVVACVDPFNTLGILTVGVTALIGFALGATITLEKAKETFSLHKRAVLIGFFCQFGFMPLIAYIYCVAFDIQPLVALGVILTGSVPGGTTSNLLTYYAKGNVALSIMMSAASTFAALGLVPFSIFLYFNTALGNGDEVNTPFDQIILALFIVIIPVSFGIFVREKSEKWAKRCEIAGSILGALFLVAAVVSGILDSPDLFDPTQFQKTWLGAALFQPIASLAGFLVSKAARLNGPELRAVVLETGVQNYTIAISAAAFSFQGCERTAVLTFILTASFWYVVNSFWITLLLRFVQARGDEEEIAEMKPEERELDTVVGA